MLPDLSPHFSAILSSIGNAHQGLTQPIFLFISQLTPMINVDLLIKNQTGQTLLTWREDEFYGPGWHVPGGVIRFKELAATRIQQVALSELGAEIESEKNPICIEEVMAPNRDVRGHFISMLYRCVLTSEPDKKRAYDASKPAQNGHWQWHDHCPSNLIAQHGMYRQSIESPLRHTIDI